MADDMQLHPGAASALKRLMADELGIARLMSEGELTSPQRYHNVTLIKLRVTGTGYSYRPQLNEYVYRRPENYLTQEFLDRCNGLPVIWKHPDTDILNSEEFGQRVVGTVMLPYIEGDEVWAVAKVYDDDAIRLLETEQLSTSPAVLLSPSIRKKLDDGNHLLIEGRPELLDHLAICENGVWDKGEGPTGVEAITEGELAMADEAKKEEEVKADAARADAEKRMDEKFDMLMKGIDAVADSLKQAHARMDAFEGGGEPDGDEAPVAEADAGGEEPVNIEIEEDAVDPNMDPEASEPEPLAADSRRDSRRRSDARVDSLQKQLEEQRRTIEALSRLVRQPIPDAHRAELAQIQSRADSVLIQMGKRAEPPLVGESPGQYRRRMASVLQPHSRQWKGVRLDALQDEAFTIAENQIFADAVVAARSPSDLERGSIRAVRRTMESGHIETTFVGGEDAHFVKQFTPRARHARILPALGRH